MKDKVMPVNLKIDETAHTLNTPLRPDEDGMYWTHTHTGPGYVQPVKEAIANVVVAYRMAERAYGTVVMYGDEDVAFGPAGVDRDASVGPWAMDEETVNGDRDALVMWWNLYGYDSGHEELREAIADLVGGHVLSEPEMVD